MREVDEASGTGLRPAQSERSAQGVPPAPHLPARALKSATRHGSAASCDRLSVELQWPALVLSLERDWGERFERMAQLLLAVRQQQGLKAILFTSCHRAEGRTTLVLTLARALARHPLRTLVVDADLTGPMVARLLGLRPASRAR